MKFAVYAMVLLTLLSSTPALAAGDMIEGTPQMVGQCMKMPHAPLSRSSSDGESVISVGYLKVGASPAMFAITCKNGAEYKLLKSVGSGKGTTTEITSGNSLQPMLAALENECK